MAQLTTCPDLQDLAKFLLGRLPAPDCERLAEHLETCAACLATVQTLQGGKTFPGGKRVFPQGIPDAPPSPLSSPRPGVQGLVEAVPGRPEEYQSPTRKIVGLATPGRIPIPPQLKAAPPPEVKPAPPIPPKPEAAPEVALPRPFPFLGPAQEPDEIGRLGPYRILKALGAGGMGIVFKAEDLQLRRPVALKVMKPDFGASGEARQRFLREARAVAAIEHDHIVTIYQVGEDRGLPFIAMQFLRGESLEDRIRREKQLPVGEVVRIGREIAGGLAAAHAVGLIHRDIKPANIWLETSARDPGASATGGRVKILDFGLARAAADSNLTRTGTVMGTPEYMSPEQARGKEVDARSDLFSLGCVLYDLCAGQPPFHARETMAVLLALASEKPRALTEFNHKVPEALVIIIMRLLAKHPDDRPASMDVVVSALEEIERQREGPPSPPRRAVQRREAPAARGVMAALVLAAIAFTGFWYRADLARLVNTVIVKLRGPGPGTR